MCVGTELSRATITDVDEDPWLPDYTNQNTEYWRALIAKARAAFSGGLTYGASWQGEAERVGFWAELDFVGSSLFNSISLPPGSAERPDDDAAMRRLRNLLRTSVELAQGQHRPALVVEVGFASTSQAWAAPIDSRGTPDPDEQARLYRVLGDALRRLGAESDELAGVYLWNWSTDPAAGGELDRSWTPQNRPAADVLADVFERCR
jgi:hypothetical protein